LDCRLSGLNEYSPIKVIIDKNLKVKKNANIFKSKNTKIIIFYNSGDKKKIKFLKSKKVKLINVKLQRNGEFDLRKVMSILYQNNIRFLLVEGGNQFTNKMLDKNLFNEFYLIKTDNKLRQSGKLNIKKIVYKLSKKFIKDPFINQKIKMDANITVMIEIKKTNKNISSYLFNDKILGWAAKENSKKRFKSKNDLWTLQSTNLWANKKINKNRENKEKNSKILIDQFFKLTGIKKTKIITSLNHGWKYSSNSRPLKVKSYWNDKLNLGVCADWFVGPRVEAGWISANDLFKKINK